MSPQNKDEYFLQSANLSLPARCPILDRCERRAHTLAVSNGWALDEANKKAGLTLPVIKTAGEFAAKIGGDTNWCVRGLCPEVNLFDTGMAITGLSGTPTVCGDYDKYMTPQVRVTETGHFSQCAEYVFYKVHAESNLLTKKESSSGSENIRGWIDTVIGFVTALLTYFGFK